MAFCTNCGQSVQAANKFCASCGAPLQPSSAPLPYTPPVQPPPQPVYQNVPPPAPVYRNSAPVYPAETVKYVLSDIWIVNSARIKETYTLIISERRSIFAKCTPQITNIVGQEARAKMDYEHKGFLGKWKASVFSKNYFPDYYKKFSPDQILQETPGNFAIDNSTILKIGIKLYNQDDAATGGYCGFEFQTVNGNLNLYSSNNYESDFKLAYGKGVVK